MKRALVMRFAGVLLVLGCGGGQGESVDAAATGGRDALCGAKPGAPGEACDCQRACADGSQCIEMPTQDWDLALICTAVESGTCSHGVVLVDQCRSPAYCFGPVFFDGAGLCLRQQDWKVLCSSDLPRVVDCTTGPDHLDASLPDGMVP